MRAAALSALILLNWVAADVICNRNTTYKCPCNLCHRGFDSQNYSAVIEFEDCNASILRLNTLREKVANWVKEECSFILHCERSIFHLGPDNVIMTELQCYDGLPSRVNFLVRWNSSRSLKPDNIFPPQLLVDVLNSREHLLAGHLHSAILQLGLGVDLAKQHGRVAASWRSVLGIAALAALGAFIGCALIAVCVLINVFGWTRLVGHACAGCVKRERPKTLQELNELSRRNEQLGDLPEWD